MSLPENIYSDAHIVDDLFTKAVWLTSVTFVLILLILFYFLLAYRARAGHLALYTHGNSKKALGLTLGLALAVFVGIDLNLAWSDHHAFEVMYGSPPKPGEAVVVQLFAKQFEWTFRYPGPDGKFGTDDDFFTVNELVVPIDRPVLLHLQSLDVIHSFFLPNARIKQDLVPGLETTLWFTLNKTTEQARKDRNDPKFDYEIACAQLCGSLHTTMRGKVTILTAAGFAAWQIKRKADIVENDYDWPSVDGQPIWPRWQPRDPDTVGYQPAGAAAPVPVPLPGEGK